MTKTYKHKTETNYTQVPPTRLIAGNCHAIQKNVLCIVKGVKNGPKELVRVENTAQKHVRCQPRRRERERTGSLAQAASTITPTPLPTARVTCCARLPRPVSCGSSQRAASFGSHGRVERVCNRGCQLTETVPGGPGLKQHCDEDEVEE